MRLFTALFLAVAAAFALPALAESVDETRPVSADVHLSVSNVSGTIEISTWDRSEVHVTGELSEDTSQLEITGGASDLRVAVKPKSKHSDSTGEAQLSLRIPVGTTLDVNAVSADVTVQGVKGPVRVSAVSGDVDLSLASAAVSVDSVSGDVQLASPSAATRIQTVSGDISATGLRGTLKLETVSGDVKVRGDGAFSQLSMKSVSGDLHLEGDLTPDAKVDGQALSGNLQYRLGDITSATIAAHSFSGDVHSDFGKASGKELDAKVGDGKAIVNLSSFSGDIELRKR